ncbi:hypothetical protein TUM4261_34830 [Shewanella sp. c952]|uniref:hypothetical protein n=1 Tax=Shewanella sp. c952 TaxID=2815913 RepID=UPI001BB89638|nr:hypothetical protein [Shewanella sp. c952]GIU16385.1 hypothetical protein TUM4261_34830 [Shewanella sp. c952]
MEIVHRAWMVEEANRYCLAAELLATHNYLHRQAQINAALSIEMLLKSFISKSDQHEGEVCETYNSKRGHDLNKLANKLPTEVCSRFGISPTKDGIPATKSRRLIERYANTFIEDRYIYESPKDKVRPGYSVEFIKLARNLINNTIEVYIETGCTDPWVSEYKSV